jgi:hypothetical protein
MQFPARTPATAAALALAASLAAHSASKMEEDELEAMIAMRRETAAL